MKKILRLTIVLTFIIFLSTFVSAEEGGNIAITFDNPPSNIDHTCETWEESGTTMYIANTGELECGTTDPIYGIDFNEGKIGLTSGGQFHLVIDLTPLNASVSQVQVDVGDYTPPSGATGVVLYANGKNVGEVTTASTGETTLTISTNDPDVTHIGIWAAESLVDEVRIEFSTGLIGIFPNFTVNKTAGETPFTAQFTDRSGAIGAEINGWLWDFGDGATSTTQNPSHTYDAVGIYDVSLTIFADNQTPKTYAIEQLISSSFPTLGFWPIGENDDAVFADGNTVYFGIGGTLEIADFTNPADPQLLGRLPLSTNQINSISVSGNYAYLTGTTGLHVVDIANPATPQEITFISIASDEAKEVTINGNYAYVVESAYSKESHLRIFNIIDPANPVEATSLMLYGYINQMAIQGNYAYVTGGSYPQAYLYSVDISDPGAPAISDTAIVENGSSYFMAIDVQGDYAYVRRAGNGDGFHVFDISDPADLTEVGSNYVSPNDILVNGDYAYLTGNANGTNGLHIYDISNPANPGYLNTTLEDNSFGKIAMSGNKLYTAASATGMYQADITDPATPVYTGIYGTQYENIYDMIAVNDYLFTTNYNYHKSFLALDASDPANMHDHSSVKIVSSHAREIVYQDNFAYVSHYYKGIFSIDVSDPTNPVIADSVEFSGDHVANMCIDVNYIYTFDSEGKLHIVSGLPNNLTEEMVFDTGTDEFISDAALHNKHLFLAKYNKMDIVDVTNIYNPQIVATYPIQGADNYDVTDIAIWGNYAYLNISPYNSYNYYLEIVNIADPQNPQLVATKNLSSYPAEMLIKDGYLYIPGGDGIEILTLENPTEPVNEGSISTGGVSQVAAKGDTLFFATGKGIYAAHHDQSLLPPVVKAEFSADVTEGYSPLDVQFYDESTARKTTITSWQWNFGDGGTSTEQNPQHTYNSIGKFFVTLTVSDGDLTNEKTRYDYITINMEAPKNPYPEDGAFGVPINTGLSWDFDPQAGSTLLYFGSNTNPNNIVYDGTAIDSLNNDLLGTLQSGTTYFWKVGTRSYDGGVYAESPIWKFTTPFPSDQPDTLWTKLFNPGDTCEGIEETNDGGFILTGKTNNGTDDDMLLIKTDQMGEIEWQQTYGMPEDPGKDIYPNDFAYDVHQTDDGGYIMAGATTGSSTSNTTNFYLVKTDSAGNQEWAYEYGNPITIDVCYSIEQTHDNGFIMAGKGGDLFGSKFYIVKTDSVGLTQWERTYFEPDTVQIVFDIHQVNDSTYIMGGNRGNGMFLLQADSTGFGEWEQVYDFDQYAPVKSIVRKDDGTIYWGGHNYLLSTNENGIKNWHQHYHGVIESIDDTDDGGFVLGGYSDAYGSDRDDFMIIKTDEYGETEWLGTFGGAGLDRATEVQQTSDGGFILGGTGYNGIYLVKIKSEPHLEAEFTANTTFGIAPLTVQFTDLSTVRGTQITSWQWDFGDGATSTDQNPTHTYDEIGLYTVSLTISDGLIYDDEIKSGYINPQMEVNVAGYYPAGIIRGMDVNNGYMNLSISKSTEIVDCTDVTSTQTLSRTFGNMYAREAMSHSDVTYRIVADNPDSRYIEARQLEIINTSDKNNIQIVATMPVENKDHSITGTPNQLIYSESEQYADSTWIYIYDMSDHQNISLTGSIKLDWDTPLIKQWGNYIFTGGKIDGHNTMLVSIDISDPANPVIADSLELPNGYPFISAFDISGDYLYALPSGDWSNTDSGRYMYIINISDPENMELRGTFDEYGIREIVVNGNTAYIAHGTGGIIMVDVSDPDNPVRGSFFGDRNHGFLTYLDIDGNHLYYGNNLFNYADYDEGTIDIYDIAGGSTPTLAGQHHFLCQRALDIEAQGNMLYIPGKEDFIELDITNPEEIYNSKFHKNLHIGYDMAIEDNHAYVLCFSGLITYDISNPFAAEKVDSLFIATYNLSNIAIQGNNAYISGTTDTVYVISIENRESPAIVAKYYSENQTKDIATDSQYVYLAQRYYGVKVVDFRDLNNIHQVAEYELAHPYRPYSVSVKDDFIFVLTENYGLLVFKFNENNQLEQVASRYIHDELNINIEITGDYVYALNWRKGLFIFDVSDPYNPFIVSQTDPGKDAYLDLAITEQMVYVNSEYGIYAIPNPAYEGTEPEIIYDIDGSGTVDVIDVQMLIHIVKTGQYNSVFDYDESGTLDMEDIMELLEIVQ